MKEYRRIIISRTDSIGDVILTLPLAGMLRKTQPGASLVFLGRSYTRPVIDACRHIDDFLDWDEISRLGRKEGAETLRKSGADLIIHVFPRREIALLAREAGIRDRLGTTNRIYHWTNCNRLVRLSRRRSELHEAQLNLRLAGMITGIPHIEKTDIPPLYGLENIETLDEKYRSLISSEKKNIILHPKSKGSAREWGLENFIQLSMLLPPEKYHIFISGTEEEGKLIRGSGLTDAAHVTDLTGKMSLGQLMSFIGNCDALVAASTGPLHIAAALGIKAIGIYPPIRPMHPGRWAPLGEKATYLVLNKECDDCRKQGPCHCMLGITPGEVQEEIEKMNI